MNDLPLADLLPTRIRQHAEERPDQCALSFLDADQQVVETLTFRELDHRARLVATNLLERGLGGEPIVLSFPPGLEFVVAFCGCLYAGAIAVPAALPQSHRTGTRLAVVLGDSGARCVLTSVDHRADLARRAIGSAKPIVIIATDLLVSPSDGGSVIAPDAARLAFLQYTSGSTRSPRGVMVRHGDLAANLNSLREILAFDEESVGVSWLPLFHDMGLIAGVLLPLWLGYSQYLMAPATFIRNPLGWLEAMSRFHGTHAGAPNFGYQACVEAASAADVSALDLTAWRVAWNGAEPVRPDTLDQFCEQFAPNGFQPESIAPAYGLAEATLVVTGGDGAKPAMELTVDAAELHIGQVRRRIDDGPNTKRLVGSGRAGTGIEVRIVRPDARRLAGPHALGEIWVRSDSVTQGYWHKPLETAETFGAYLATGEGPYLRTGDLGFLDDGELYVIGRLKDVIVIRGVNYYPHDIEHTVERSHPALQPDAGAVVGVDVAGRVDLVVVHEIRRDHAESFAGDEVVNAIRRAVAREHQLALHRVVLLRPGRLPKTSSGKVQRAKCKDELAAETLAVVHAWQMSAGRSASIELDLQSLRQPGVLERQLVHWLQQELSVTDLTWQTPLFELGVDSLRGVELVNVLSAAFDYTFPPTSMLDHPSVASLASLIRGIKLGSDTDTAGRNHAYSAEHIETLDEREVTELLLRRIDDVLDGGRS